MKNAVTAAYLVVGLSYPGAKLSVLRVWTKLAFDGLQDAVHS